MDWEFETDTWALIPTKKFKQVDGKRKVRLVVIHSMEAAEIGSTAEAVANYFATSDKQSSAHLCVDNNSIVQCVLDNNIAWAAPGANSDGIHIEMAGYAKQTREEWLDAYSVLVMENAARASAQYCMKYNIPVRHLSNAELADKSIKGIVSHAQVTEVFKKGTHSDPGIGFPWDYFIARVEESYQLRKKSFQKI